MTTRTHRRAANIALAVVAALMVVALYKGTHGSHAVGATRVPSGANLGVIGWALIPVAFVAGQLHRGHGHWAGIRRSHLSAIVGWTAALIGLGVAAFVMVGGAR